MRRSTAAEENYRALAESSPQLVWTTTPDGRVSYCNRRYLDFIGLTLEQIRGGTWDQFIHPEDAPRAESTWNAALASGEPFECEYRLRHADDGSYRWFLARGVAVRDGDGRITRWVGSSTDIEDRKRTEDTQRFLAEAGALLSSSLDYQKTLPALAQLAVPHMADWCSIDLLGDAGRLERVAVVHVDPGRVELVHEIERRYPTGENDAAMQVVRTRASARIREVTDEMLAASARDASHLELVRELGLRSWMAVPITVHNRSLGVIAFASAESGRLFEARDQEVAEEVGRRVGVMIDNARLFEMTQRERLRAEEANRAKDELLSVTSHELRTPLNAILGWSRMLRAGTLSEEKRARALETIERNAKVQVQLVEDLLDFSRVVTGKLRLALAPVEPTQVVEAAVEVVRPAAEAKGVRLQVLLDPDAGVLSGDAGRLQQVVWNLLSNAVKFTPKGGRVYVRMQREDSSVEIVVGDTGPGIDPAFLPHVFQPFRQQDASITRRHGGLGLGLAIVKHLVELHGGTIEAEERRPRARVRPSSFDCRSRRCAPRPSSPPAAPAAHAIRPGAPLRCPPELDGLRVLVCEDEPDARELIESILAECKATVVVTGSAAEAMDRIRRGAARCPRQRHRNARCVGLRAHSPGPSAAAREGRPHARGGADRVRLDERPDASADGGIHHPRRQADRPAGAGRGDCRHRRAALPGLIAVRRAPRPREPHIGADPPRRSCSIAIDKSLYFFKLQRRVQRLPPPPGKVRPRPREAARWLVRVRGRVTLGNWVRRNLPKQRSTDVLLRCRAYSASPWRGPCKVKPESASRLKIGRGAGRVLFVVEGDGSAVVVYGEQPSARFASLGELLELHGLAEADVEETSSRWNDRRVARVGTCGERKEFIRP